MSDYPPPQYPGQPGWGPDQPPANEQDATQVFQPGQQPPGNQPDATQVFGPGQPPYSQQPGYGQPPEYGQQPPYGQPPEDGQQGYGQPPYGTGPGGPGGPGGPTGPGGPPGAPPYGEPPRKGNRTAVIAGSAAVALIAGGVVAAVLLTGGDDNTTPAAGSGMPTVVPTIPTLPNSSGLPTVPTFPVSPSLPSISTSATSTGGDADTVFHTFNQALQSHDLTAVKATLCSDVRSGLGSISQTDLDEVNSVTELLAPSASGTGVGKISVNATGDSGTESEDLNVTVVNEGTFCVQDLTLIAGGSSGSPSALSS